MSDRRYGIVLGRFQPVHFGHLEYLRAARQRCERLVIGITNPDLFELGWTPDDPARSTRHNNPFSYHQRATMLEAACLDDGWRHRDFTIAPAPIDQIERLRQYLPAPEQATFFVTIYDDWGETKKRLLEGLGYDVETLWRRSMADRLTSGTEIRHNLLAGSPDWRRYVSPRVARLLEDYVKHM